MADNSASGESVRDMRAIMELTKTADDSLRVLEAARRRWPVIHRALQNRIAEGRPIGSLANIPAVVLASLAAAQAHQDTIFLAVRDSVRRGAAALGSAGSRLIAAFADDTQFAGKVLALIKSDGFPIRMSLLEFVGGIMPVGYLAMALVAARRSSPLDNRGRSLIALAANTSIVDPKSGKLDITHGARKLIAAWIEAVKLDRPFPTSDL